MSKSRPRPSGFAFTNINLSADERRELFLHPLQQQAQSLADELLDKEKERLEQRWKDNDNRFAEVQDRIAKGLENSTLASDIYNQGSVIRYAIEMVEHLKSSLEAVVSHDINFLDVDSRAKLAQQLLNMYAYQYHNQEKVSYKLIDPQVASELSAWLDRWLPTIHSKNHFQINAMLITQDLDMEKDRLHYLIEDAKRRFDASTDEVKKELADDKKQDSPDLIYLEKSILEFGVEQADNIKSKLNTIVGMNANLQDKDSRDQFGAQLLELYTYLYRNNDKESFKRLNPSIFNNMHKLVMTWLPGLIAKQPLQIVANLLGEALDQEAKRLEAEHIAIALKVKNYMDRRESEPGAKDESAVSAGLMREQLQLNDALSMVTNIKSYLDKVVSLNVRLENPDSRGELNNQLNQIVKLINSKPASAKLLDSSVSQKISQWVGYSKKIIKDYQQRYPVIEDSGHHPSPKKKF